MVKFPEIFGNVQKQQDELQAKLAEIEVEAEAGDGAVRVTARGDLQIENIRLDPTKINFTDHEQLEDLLVVATNRALDLARQKAGEESAKLVKDLFPFGNLDQFMQGSH